MADTGNEELDTNGPITETNDISRAFSKLRHDWPSWSKVTVTYRCSGRYRVTKGDARHVQRMGELREQHPGKPDRALAIVLEEMLASELVKRRPSSPEDFT